MMTKSQKDIKIESNQSSKTYEKSSRAEFTAPQIFLILDIRKNLEMHSKSASFITFNEKCDGMKKQNRKYKSEMAKIDILNLTKELNIEFDENLLNKKILKEILNTIRTIYKKQSSTKQKISSKNTAQKPQPLNNTDPIKKIKDYSYPQITMTKLCEEIFKYENENHAIDPEKVLGEEASKLLYKGKENYTEAYEKRVANFSSSHASNMGLPERLENQNFFMNQFIAYCISNLPKFPKLEANLDKGKLSLKEAKQSTINMQKLLGKEGLKLYKLALEEESFRKEFIDAIFIRATQEIHGPEWNERPFIIVAGPSASGKSSKLSDVIAHTQNVLKTECNNSKNTVNYFTSIDGGLIRETSHVRKLAIQIANSRGFTGIKDLHKQSKILEKVKKSLEKAVMKSKNKKLGAVFPETFSGWFNPFSKIRSLMKRIDKLPNVKQFFSRVISEDPKFKNTVKAMGTKRAWETEADKLFAPTTQFDLNQENLAESKSYNKLGFFFGWLGSIIAEWWFKSFSKNGKDEKYLYHIENDLILLKPAKNNDQNNEWVAAKPKDADVILVSKKIFESWKSTNKTETLPVFNASQKQKIHSSTQQIFNQIAPEKKSAENLNDKMPSKPKNTSAELNFRFNKNTGNLKTLSQAQGKKVTYR